MAVTPAGWYPDPVVPSLLRYWDGQAWTAHTAPAGGAAPQDAAAVTPAEPVVDAAQTPAVADSAADAVSAPEAAADDVAVSQEIPVSDTPNSVEAPVAEAAPVAEIAETPAPVSAPSAEYPTQAYPAVDPTQVLPAQAAPATPNYGAAGNQWSQQPYGQSGQVPPANPGSNKNLLWIILGSVVAIGAIVAAIVILTGKDKDKDPAPVPTPTPSISQSVDPSPSPSIDPPLEPIEPTAPPAGGDSDLAIAPPASWSVATSGSGKTAASYDSAWDDLVAAGYVTEEYFISNTPGASAGDIELNGAWMLSGNITDGGSNVIVTTTHDADRYTGIAHIAGQYLREVEAAFATVYTTGEPEFFTTVNGYEAAFNRLDGQMYGTDMSNAFVVVTNGESNVYVHVTLLPEDDTDAMKELVLQIGNSVKFN